MYRLIAALTLFWPMLVAQQTGSTRIYPDCVVPITPTTSRTGFTATGSTASFDNRTQGCKVWYLSYYSTGFSALSIVVQTADDSSGSPGAWGTFTAATGSNPNTTTTHASASFSDNPPWVRVTLSSVTGTGTISGTLYGWKTNQATAAGGGGGGGGDVNIIEIDGTAVIVPGLAGVLPAAGPETTGSAPSAYPIQLGNLDGAGNLQRAFVCSQTAAISTSSSGNTQLIALSASKVIRVCNVSFTAAAATNIKFTQGTGANCGTGTADITAALEFPTFAAASFDMAGSLRTSASQALCINSSNAVSLKGWITYAQF